MSKKIAYHVLWKVTAPQPPPTQKLGDQFSADAVIIGDGYTGFTDTLHLAESGAWCSREKIGPKYGNRFIDVIGHSSEQFFKLVEKHRIPCKALRKGFLHFAHSPNGFRVQQKRG